MNSWNNDSKDPALNIDYYLNYGDYPYFHDHDYWEFFIVNNGKYRHVINGKTFEMIKNQAFLIRPKDYHAIFNGNSTSNSHLNIMIKSAYLKDFCDSYSSKLYDNLTNNSEFFVSLNDSQVNKIITYTSLLKDHADNSIDRSLINHLLLSYILEKAISQNDFLDIEKPKWLSNLLIKINDPNNISWSVEDCLKECAYSHTHFAREFKKYLNCTLERYLTKTKMSYAHDLLTHSNMSMQEISLTLGYSSLSVFNHSFKKYFGVSPSQYKKVNKNYSLLK